MGFPPFPPPPPPPEIHVLAVDDSTIERKVMEKLLTTSSFKVTSVESALRALDILGIGQTQHPLSANAYCINLIITDYCMPGMTGYELLKKVKETSALKEIPVVVMSSENVPNRINRCLEEGAEEFILKPLQLSDVKRLKAHITQAKLQAMDQSDKAASSKRKAPKETMEIQSQAQRRPRLDAVVTVT